MSKPGNTFGTPLIKAALRDFDSLGRTSGRHISNKYIIMSERMNNHTRRLAFGLSVSAWTTVWRCELYVG